MKNFEADIEAAKHYIRMHEIEDVDGSHRKVTLTIELGNMYLGNRGTESVMGVGDALVQLRNEAGLTPGQIAISRGDDRVTIQTTMENWNTLREHVEPGLGKPQARR